MLTPRLVLSTLSHRVLKIVFSPIQCSMFNDLNARTERLLILSFRWHLYWCLWDKTKQLCDHPKPVLLHKHHQLLQRPAGLWKLLTVSAFSSIIKYVWVHFLSEQNWLLGQFCRYGWANYPSMSPTGCSTQSGLKTPICSLWWLRHCPAAPVRLRNCPRSRGSVSFLPSHTFCAVFISSESGNFKCVSSWISLTRCKKFRRKIHVNCWAMRDIVEVQLPALTTVP